MDARHPSRSLGLSLAFSGVVIASVDGLLVRLVQADLWLIVFWRSLFVVITLSFFIGLRRELNESTFKLGLWGTVAAFSFGFSTICFIFAVKHSSVAETLLILSCSPIFAAVISLVILEEKASFRLLVSSGFIVIGLVLLFFPMGQHIFGNLAAFIGSFLIGLCLVSLRKAQAKSNFPHITLGAFVAVLAALVVIKNQGNDIVMPNDVIYLLLMGVLVTPLSVGLITKSVQWISASEVTLIMLLEVILGSLWVWYFLGEFVTVEILIGGAVILIGISFYFCKNERSNQ